MNDYKESLRTIFRKETFLKIVVLIRIFCLNIKSRLWKNKAMIYNFTPYIWYWHFLSISLHQANDKDIIPEFKSILDLIKAFPDEQSCIEHIERLRWNGSVVSPFDSESKVYKCAGNKYKCKSTGKYFNVKVGTIFENTNIPLQKWFLALYVFSSHKKGISSHQLAKDIDVTQKSAWFMLHRLRYAFDHPNFKEVC